MNPASTAFAATMLDGDTRRVILEMAGYDHDCIPYVRMLASDLDMPVEALRRILRQLLDRGLVTYGPVFNQDTGTPMGSTYWLTESGVQLRTELERKAA